MANKQQGHIKKWQDDKGFGFIETAAGESVFFMSARLKPSVVPKLASKWFL